MPKGGSDLQLDGQGKPLWLVLELTYRCPLACPWCSNPTDLENYADELDTETWKRVLREARAIGSLQLGFTGGEPALRNDLEELVGYAEDLGFYTNLITSGMGLNRKRLETLKDAGLKQIQLSLQHTQADINDSLVGARSFNNKLTVLEEIKSLGFPVVLNVPVSRHNIDNTGEMLRLAESLGIEFVEFANLQYYNWALLNRPQLMPTEEQIKAAEEEVQAARERVGNRMSIYFVIPDYFDGRPKACMNGWGAILCTIAPDGTALPCQQARSIDTLAFPSVRDHDLAWIWRDSPAFNAFRGDGWMKEPCRSCSERHEDFGGCRCQAYLLTGDAANTDPACSKSPHHHVVREAVEASVSPEQRDAPLIMRDHGPAPRRARPVVSS